MDWKEALSWSEGELEELRHTGFAYIQQGKYEIALKFFKALVILQPDSVYDASTLGALYLQLNMAEEALPHFERALQLEKEKRGPILLNLSKAFFSMGRREEGIKIAQTIGEDPDPLIANGAKALLLAYR